ncbi:MAG: CRISPR-associated endonuclease Cas2 [Azovibrio sp.]|uniref:CRISPR-associated endonuclease Cas2 n=1 Tax=Azovibrio sp. TaxID=1872673 RepID=UPI003C787111
MRCLYLVCYDISCPKRLYRVHRFLLGYKTGGQKSFFECWLSPAELSEVRRGLLQRMNPDEDRAHIFQLDPRQQTRQLGAAKAPHNGAFMIL